MNGDLKNTFMIHAVSQYHEMVRKEMRVKMIKQKVGISNDAYDSIAYKVANKGSGVVSELSFKEYLRMIDMGVGRSHPLGGLKSMKIKLQSINKEGEVLVKDRTRKAKKIYSKTAYGNLTWLGNKLLYGFTQETIQMLQKELTYQQNTR